MIKKFIQRVKEEDFYFYLMFLFVPYFIGIPAYFLSVPRQHIIIEIFMPWLFGLILLIPIGFFIAITFGFYIFLKHLILMISDKNNE